MMRFVLACRQALQNRRVEHVFLGRSMTFQVLSERRPQRGYGGEIAVPFVVEFGEAPTEQFVVVEDQVADVRHATPVPISEKAP